MILSIRKTASSIAVATLLLGLTGCAEERVAELTGPEAEKIEAELEVKANSLNEAADQAVKVVEDAVAAEARDIRNQDAAASSLSETADSEDQ